MDKRPYPEKGRERIQASLILDRLNKHILGECELQPTQISAARILLAKVLPDLKAEDVTISGNVTQTHSVDAQSVEQAVDKLQRFLNTVRA